MYLDQHFADFLTDEVNPKNEGVKRAKEAHEDVRAFLQSDDGLGDEFTDSFLAGSYARDTSIDPIKDVDVVIITNREKDDPLTVLRELRKTLKKHYDKTDDETANQRRSVRVDLDELSMDIIPAIAPNGPKKPIKIPDRKLKTWVDTNPRGHIDLAQQRNAASSEISGQHIYIPTVKLLRWWKHHQLPKQRNPKGFLVEILAYECAPKTAVHWAESVKATTDTIAERYGKYRDGNNPPEIDDPAMPGAKVKTKLTAAEFTTFLVKLDAGRELMSRAIAEEDQDAAAKLYCEFFKEGFPCPESGKRAPVITSSERRVTEPRRFA